PARRPVRSEASPFATSSATVAEASSPTAVASRSDVAMPCTRRAMRTESSSTTGAWYRLRRSGSDAEVLAKPLVQLGQSQGPHVALDHEAFAAHEERRRHPELSAQLLEDAGIAVGGKRVLHARLVAQCLRGIELVQDVHADERDVAAD